VSRHAGLSASDRDCPAVPGSSGTQRARPLRPELAAPLGVCPLPQLMVGVGGSSRSLLSGDVAVFCCCTGELRVSFVGPARCAVPTCRPSAFQAGHLPSWRGSCECYALSSVAAASRWLLLLLSPLLSVAANPQIPCSGCRPGLDRSHPLAGAVPAARAPLAQ